MCALKFVAAQAKTYDIDPTKLVVMGESAGGHLALTTGMIPKSAGLDKGREPQNRKNKLHPVIMRGVSGIQSFFSSSESTAMWQQCVAAAPDMNTLNQGGCYVKGKSLMVPPKAGTFGTIGRNIFRDSDFKNVDFSVFKTFAFKEWYGAQFRVEFFNIFNHPVLANPYGAAVAGVLATIRAHPAASAAGARRRTSRRAIRSSAREATE